MTPARSSSATSLSALALDRHVDGLRGRLLRAAGTRSPRRRRADHPTGAPCRRGARAAWRPSMPASRSATRRRPVPGHRQLEAAPDAGRDAARRHYLRAQAVGLLTTARKLAGEPIGYADEVEACYGVRPTQGPSKTILEAAHRRLDEVVPGTGPLAGRLTWPGARRRPCRPTGWSRRSPRSPRTSGSGPGSCSVCPRASTSTSSWSPTSRGAASTTTWAGCARGSRSTPTFRCSPPRSPTSWRTRPIPATTPSTPARRSASSGGAAGGRSRSSSSERRSACSPRDSPISVSRW